MRPPRRLIEPRMAGVSIADARRPRQRRLAGLGDARRAGAVGTVPGTGADGPPAWLGEGWPGTGGCVCWVIGRLAAVALLEPQRHAEEVVPADQHDARQDDGEEKVLVVFTHGEDPRPESPSKEEAERRIAPCGTAALGRVTIAEGAIDVGDEGAIGGRQGSRRPITTTSAGVSAWLAPASRGARP